MAGHPLLTKVWRDVLVAKHGGSRVAGADGAMHEPAWDVWAADNVSAIPPDIADRLERALDVCQHRFDADGEPCEFPERAIAHHNPFGHPFTPLVQP